MINNESRKGEDAHRDIDRERFEMEMAKSEFEMANLIQATEMERARLHIESARLQLEGSRAKLEQNIWKKNSGTIITALVAAVAVIISAAQVWSAHISKNREIELMEAQKEKELSLAQVQRQVAQEQQDREWNLSLAKFVMDNRKALFDGTPDETRILANTIPAVFPKEVANSLLLTLEDRAASLSTKQIWREARAENISTVNGSRPPTPQINNQRSVGTLYGHIEDLWDKSPIPGARIVARNENTKIEYQVAADAEGDFQTSLPIGDYTITISKRGYKPNVGYSQIKLNQTYVVDFGKLQDDGTGPNRVPPPK